MSPQPEVSQPIQVGDTVAYILSTGELVHNARGKVLALFKTRRGETLADVEWNSVGPPKRVDVTHLTKVYGDDGPG